MLRSRVGDVMLEIDGRAARAVIDREEAMNSLSPSVITGLNAAIDAAIEAKCSVFVLRGAGGTLSTGADLKYLRGILDDEAALPSYIGAIGRVLDRLAVAPLVTIGVVDGYAVAGGCEILLACDLAVVADDAHIGDRHLEYGLLPGAGGSVRLSHATAPKLARRLLYTGEIIDGVTAARFGLVSHSVPAQDLPEAVDALVQRLVRHSPTALAAMKRLHLDGLALDPSTAAARELDTLIRHLTRDASAREGLDAFAERRDPDFAPDGEHRNGVTASTRDLAMAVSVAGEAQRAVSGRSFEQLSVGTRVHHVTRRTVTETDNVLFTTMTMNPAPLHLDAVYASQTEFGRPLINSMFTLALVVGLSVAELTLGTIIAQLGLSNVEFPAPVFAGDTIRVESAVVEARASASRPGAGVVVFEHCAFNQRGELVCRARRTGLMKRMAADVGTPS